MSTQKKIVFFIIWLVASVVFVLFFSEIGLRLYYYKSLKKASNSFSLRKPHPTRGWALKPNCIAFNQNIDYTTSVEINSHGFRDLERAYSAKPGVKRILVLGDSFMEAYQVDLEDSFSQKLNAYLGLKSIEVLSMGVGGYGTTQEYLTFLKEGLKYQPSAVILAVFLGNDLMNNSKELETLFWGRETLKTIGRPFMKFCPASGELNLIKPQYQKAMQWVEKAKAKKALKNKKQSLCKQSLLFELVSDIFREKKQGKIKTIYDPNIMFGPYLSEFNPKLGKKNLTAERYQKLWASTWQSTFAQLELIKNLCEEKGIEFFIITVPAKIQVEESYLQRVKTKYPDLKFNLSLPNQKISEWCNEKQIECLDLLPVFKEAFGKNGQPLFYQYRDKHWNKNGHDLAAQKTAENLKTKIEWLTQAK